VVNKNALSWSTYVFSSIFFTVHGIGLAEEDSLVATVDWNLLAGLLTWEWMFNAWVDVLLAHADVVFLRRLVLDVVYCVGAMDGSKFDFRLHELGFAGQAKVLVKLLSGSDLEARIFGLNDGRVHVKLRRWSVDWIFCINYTPKTHARQAIWVQGNLRVVKFALGDGV
jgi:hypothetical protein